MSGTTLGNNYSNEGSLSGSPVVITFPWKARKAVITNDSTVNNITVTIQGQIITLLPKETAAIQMFLAAVTLNGTATYRVWAFG